MPSGLNTRKEMSENPISISNLNDFIFCPVSIYFHSLDIDTDRMSYQDEFQINGTAAHDKIDNGQYSNRTAVLQAVPVYCESYNLYGKIDVFDSQSGILTERKKKISTVYDGYVFQLFAQYFALCEMGYDVKIIRLYSMDDNKVFDIDLPTKKNPLFNKFEKLMIDIQRFKLDSFVQTNALKCEKCIYEPLCSFSCKKDSGQI